MIGEYSARVICKLLALDEVDQLPYFFSYLYSIEVDEEILFSLEELYYKDRLKPGGWIVGLAGGNSLASLLHTRKNKDRDFGKEGQLILEKIVKNVLTNWDEKSQLYQHFAMILEDCLSRDGVNVDKLVGRNGYAPPFDTDEVV